MEMHYITKIKSLTYARFIRRLMINSLVIIDY